MSQPRFGYPPRDFTGHRDFRIQVGKWKFENWHLYLYSVSTSANGKWSWMTWRRLI